MPDYPLPPSEVSWDDACWQMVMECGEHEDPEMGFKTPSAEIVAKYCLLYPQHSEDFIDFAATCEWSDRWNRAHPPPEPTEAELKRGVARAMRAFRNAMRRVNRKKAKDAR